MADKDKLNKFYAEHKELCLAFNNWIKRQMKSFSLPDALDCVFNFTNGNDDEMVDVIRQITAKKKVYGRTQVHNDTKMPAVDIVRNNDGNLTVTGYSPKGVSEGRIIVIDESVVEQLKDDYRMTEFRFNSNVKKFLHDLLVDPINADTNDLLKANGLDRNTLLRHLRDCGIVTSKQHINDKDENGSLKTATMKVRYAVPKKNFNRKLKRLFIKLFEENLPINEDDGGCGFISGGGDAGQFSQPLFSKPVKQKGYAETMDEASTTQTVGNYQYDVPFAGDKETLSRHNGVGGSVSINFDDKNKKRYQKR